MLDKDEPDLAAILAAVIAEHGRDERDLAAIFVAVAAANDFRLTMDQAAEILLLEKTWNLPDSER